MFIVNYTIVEYEYYCYNLRANQPANEMTKVKYSTRIHGKVLFTTTIMAII